MPYDQYGKFVPTSTPLTGKTPEQSFKAPIPITQPKQSAPVPIYQPASYPVSQSQARQGATPAIWQPQRQPWQAAAVQPQTIATSGRVIDPREKANEIKLSQGAYVNYPQTPFTPQGFASGAAINTPGFSGVTGPTVESGYADALLNKPLKPQGFGGAPGFTGWSPAPGVAGHYLSTAEQAIPAGMGSDIPPQVKATSGGEELGYAGRVQGGGFGNKELGIGRSFGEELGIAATSTPGVGPYQDKIPNFSAPREALPLGIGEKGEPDYLPTSFPVEPPPPPEVKPPHPEPIAGTREKKRPKPWREFNEPPEFEDNLGLTPSWSKAAKKAGNWGVDPATGKTVQKRYEEPGAQAPVGWPYDFVADQNYNVKRKRNPLLEG